MRGAAVVAFGLTVLGFGLACSGMPSTCTVGETNCENNTLSVCDGTGTWQKTTDCPTGTSCGEVQGVEACVPDGADGGGGGGGGGGGKAGKRKAGGNH